jgi:UDP-glucose 4-epimerase
MDVLITGGAGYIGSIVSRHMLEAGHTVRIFDSLERGHRDAVPSDVELIVSDLRDGDAVARAFSRGYDAVLHFAAFALVAESVADPALYYHNNVGGTLNLLTSMVRSDTPRLVFSSTYGASKLAADHLIASHCSAHGIAAASLRYFNVAGAHGEIGEVHEPETHLIPNLLGVALGHTDAAQMFGTDFPTPDGTAIRDYIHVDDLASAHVLALEHTHPGAHQIFNLGTGEGFSVRDVVAAVRTVTGHPIPVIESPRRPGDPPWLVASAEKAKRELGWTPTRSSLEQMVGDAWSFATAHPGGY